MPSASLSRCWPLLWGLCLGLTLPGSGASAQSGAPASPLKGRTWELIPVGDAAATGDDTAAGEGSTPEKKPQAPTPAEPSALPSVPAPTAAALQPPAGQLDETDEPSHPAPKRGPRVALIDFESTTLDKDQVKALSQALWARLDASPDLALFPRSATRRWLIRHDLFPFTPYQAPVTAEKVTSALKADYLLTGHLDQIDGSFSLDINLYSNRARRCILQDVKIEKASWDALLESFAPLGKQLYLAVIGNETVLASQFGPQPEPPAAEIPPLTVKPQPLPPVTKTETPKSQGASKTGRNTKKKRGPGPRAARHAASADYAAGTDASSGTDCADRKATAGGQAQAPDGARGHA